jgi:hypothetical protein
MEILDQLATQAAAFAAAASAQSGEQLDFSPESLATLDNLLDQWLHFAEVYGGEKPLDLSPYAASVAAYAGTVLQRALDGEWVVPAEPGSQPYLRFGDTLNIDVLSIVEQSLARSQRLSLWETYLALKRRLATRTDLTNAS